MNKLMPIMIEWRNLIWPALFSIVLGLGGVVYGVGAANLFWLPFANKIKSIVGREMVKRAMIVEGLVAVANGDNPRLIETRLRGFIAE